MAHTGSQMSQAEKPVWILQSVYASSPVKLLPFSSFDELMNAGPPYSHFMWSKMLKPLPLKIGVPQNGWFIMEHPMNKWMIWVPLFLKILKPHSPESKLRHAEIHAKYLQASSPRPFHAKPRYCKPTWKNTFHFPPQISFKKICTASTIFEKVASEVLKLWLLG